MTPRWKWDTAARKKLKSNQINKQESKKNNRLKVMAGRLTAPTPQGKDYSQLRAKRRRTPRMIKKNRSLDGKLQKGEQPPEINHVNQRLEPPLRPISVSYPSLPSRATRHLNTMK